jgi:phosphoserine phosphatase
MTRPIIVSDMDGTLTTAETWRGVHQWIRANYPSPAASRFITVRLPLVFLARSGFMNKERFRARWLEDQTKLLRGLRAEQLAAMGEWVVEHFLWPARRVAAVTAVQAAHAAARATDPATELVLATGGYQPIAAAFAKKLGATIALGTPFEVIDGVATGKLAAPTQSGEEKAVAVRAAAAGGGILAAFGDTAADIPLLRLAARPIVVAPDRALQRVALAEGWESLPGMGTVR